MKTLWPKFGKIQPKSYCLRVTDFLNDRVPVWARAKGLKVKNFVFGKIAFVSFENLNDEITKIVQQEIIRNVPIRLVVHAGENEEAYCAKNKISAFEGLWGDVRRRRPVVLSRRLLAPSLSPRRLHGMARGPPMMTPSSRQLMRIG